MKMSWIKAVGGGGGGKGDSGVIRVFWCFFGGDQGETRRPDFDYGNACKMYW